MANKQLYDYIQQQLQSGFSKEQIKQSLLASSWSAGDIEEAFDSSEAPFTPIFPGSEAKSPKLFRVIKIVVVICSILIGILLILFPLIYFTSYITNPNLFVLWRILPIFMFLLGINALVLAYGLIKIKKWALTIWAIFIALQLFFAVMVFYLIYWTLIVGIFTLLLSILYILALVYFWKQKNSLYKK